MLAHAQFCLGETGMRLDLRSSITKNSQTVIHKLTQTALRLQHQN